MAWLLDTNILSELRRPKPEPRVVAFVTNQPLEQLHISVVTLAEILYGIELVTEPNRRAELNEWLRHKVRPLFDQRVLPITEDIMLEWGCWLKRVGRPATRSPSQTCLPPRQPFTMDSRWLRVTEATTTGHTCRSSSLGENSAAFLFTAPIGSIE